MSFPLDPAVFVPFVIAVALVELTPGPNMGWLALLAARRGRAAGAAAIAGVTLGLCFYMLAAAFGVAEIIMISRPLYELLRWAGVLYLLWLAWETWSGKDGVRPEAEAGANSDYILRHGFVRGLIANLLNPKAAMFYLAILPNFVVPGRASPLAQTLLLGATHLLVSVAVHGAIVLAAGGAYAYLNANGRELVVRRVFGLGIAAIAIWLVFSTQWVR
ncbi:MAG: LysE family translocator [Hyphomonadaceae bacterium]|nr:LysE family translocator [Hyphomonadaceae bacterium]